MKIIERIFDANTGQTIDIEREMTQQEIAEHEAAIAKAAAKAQAEAEAAAKKATAEAKLATLGLTADDLKALGLGGN